MISGECDNCSKDINSDYIYCQQCYDSLLDDLRSIEEENHDLKEKILELKEALDRAERTE
jgi:hypothetical protein